jgi:murein L,D-transpeptidase YcbB/YkuD
MFGKTTVGYSIIMFKKISLFIILQLLLFITISCDNKPDPGLDDKLNFDKQEFVDQIKLSFSTIDSLDIIKKSLDDKFDTLKYIYSKRNYEPFFVESFNSKSKIDSILIILGNAYEHGLNAEMYDYSIIKNKVKEIFSDYSRADDKVNFNFLAISEILLTNAVLKFSEHMRHGVVNPRKLYPEVYYLPVNDSLNQKYFEPLEHKNIVTYLQNIQPKSEKYKKLQTELLKFEKLKEIYYPHIAVTENKIEIGNESALLKNIYQKLIVFGFIDTSKTKLSISTIYDSTLSPFIKEFQRANGLIADGVIGKPTIERLNITPKEYVEKIKLNLERFRWINYSDTAKYIVVNIPDFKLYAVENGIEKFDIKICTGRKTTWETPNLYGQISYFVLNPTWSVPRSIIDEEIVSGLRRDSSYLKKRNFVAYKSGKQVSLSGLTASELAANRYSLVQNPGAGNALGKIKFMFKNPFGVYLHDTPTRAPFNYVNRAVSHGCMRVEKPMQLAEYFLTNNSNWTLDYLKIEIGQKVINQTVIDEYKSKRSELRKNSSYGITTEVKLDKYVPLFVDYYTVWVDKDGKLNYRDDVYGRDKKLKESLFTINK